MAQKTPQNTAAAALSPQAAASVNLGAKLREIEKELSARIIGRQREIQAAVLGLVAGEPVLYIGPPGTAKTMLVETLAKLISARYFYRLLTKFTELDEILGPVDVVALRQGEYRRRVDGYLPTANVIFLDEIFKASSAIRNTLLDILLYRRLHNGGGEIKLNIVAIYSASNEVSYDAEDAAFYDRFVVRDFHTYIDDSHLVDLIRAGVTNDAPPSPIMSLEEVKALQDTVAVVAASNATSPLTSKLVDIVKTLRSKGVSISDRRVVKAWRVAAAAAVAAGRTQIRGTDVATAVRFVFVNEEKDKQIIEETLAQIQLDESAVLLNEIRAIKSLLESAYQRIQSTDSISEIKAAAAEAFTAVKKLREYKDIDDIEVRRAYEEASALAVKVAELAKKKLSL